MALTWDISNVADWKELSDSDFECVITDVIIWGCISTGIGEITEKNWEEWFVRFAWNEQSTGRAWIQDSDGNSVFMKPEWVKRRIGLKTNVFPEMTRAKWIRKELDAEKRKIQDRLCKIESELRESEVA